MLFLQKKKILKRKQHDLENEDEAARNKEDWPEKTESSFFCMENQGNFHSQSRRGRKKKKGKVQLHFLSSFSSKASLSRAINFITE